LISHNVYVSPAIRGNHVGTTIPNPIPATRAQRQEGIPKVDILVVARHSAEKALDRIITAMSLLEEKRSLTLLGDGPLSSQLRDLARRSKAGERIQFLGSLPTQEVRQAMANCRCLVLPSRWEAMPMVLLEAIAEDAPILVSRIPEHKLFIENGAALPFEGDDPRSLVTAIKHRQ
jgi:glycosyltransferase involved in cell wall biosynthesis